jgi:uncharacterized MnhB-related membrane protein
MPPLLTAAVVLAAALGTTVAIVRDPGRQALVQAIYGVVLTIVFVLLQAPDVALSQIAVGAVLQPVLALAMLARIRRIRR